MANNKQVITVKDPVFDALEDYFANFRERKFWVSEHGFSVCQAHGFILGQDVYFAGGQSMRGWRIHEVRIVGNASNEMFDALSKASVAGYKVIFHDAYWARGACEEACIFCNTATNVQNSGTTQQK